VFDEFDPVDLFNDVRISMQQLFDEDGDKYLGLIDLFDVELWEVRQRKKAGKSLGKKRSRSWKKWFW
jgi:hypothetical protein